MKIKTWAECEDRTESEEGNRIEFDNGITFFFNHNNGTALMNANDASEDDRIEACKVVASFGYKPEIDHG